MNIKKLEVWNMKNILYKLHNYLCKFICTITIFNGFWKFINYAFKCNKYNLILKEWIYTRKLKWVIPFIN